MEIKDKKIDEKPLKIFIRVFAQGNIFCDEMRSDGFMRDDFFFVVSSNISFQTNFFLNKKNENILLEF